MAVVWTRTSELSLLEILFYIQTKFGVLVAEQYYFDVLETIEAIEKLPDLFPIFSNNSQTRKAIINKKTALYYKTDNDTLFLLAFYDTRKGTHKL